MIHEQTFKERLATLVGTSGNDQFESNTGLTSANIHKYLSGEELPTLRVLGKIAEANKVSICWLIGEEEHPFGSSAIHPHFQSKSMQEMAQWIAQQNDGINYWEVAKARLVRDFPDFKEWLKRKYNQK